MVAVTFDGSEKRAEESEHQSYMWSLFIVVLHLLSLFLLLMAFSTSLLLLLSFFVVFLFFCYWNQKFTQKAKFMYSKKAAPYWICIMSGARYNAVFFCDCVVLCWAITVLSIAWPASESKGDRIYWSESKRNCGYSFECNVHHMTHFFFNACCKDTKRSERSGLERFEFFPSLEASI